MDTSAAKSRNRDLISIQYLRGLAAVMVIAFHLGHQLSRMGYTGPWCAGLGAGTDVFFVISGFIMWMTTRTGASSPGDFLKRRVLRIVPLYWVVTTLMVMMLVGAPGLIQSAIFKPAHVLASYAFLPALNPATDQLEPVLQPGWTLNCEMFFYVIFATLLAMPRLFRFWGLMTVLVTLAGIGYAAPIPKTSVLSFYTSSVLVEFALGVALARLVTETEVLHALPVRVGLGMSIAAFAMILIWPEVLPPDLPSRTALGLSATLVITGLLCMEAHGALPRLKSLRLIGDASYSIYLSQVVTLSAASQVWRRLHLDAVTGGWIGFTAFGLVAATLGGVVVFWAVERSLNASLRAHRSRVPVAPLAATPIG